MVERLFNGEEIRDILPETAKIYGIVIDTARAAKFNLLISDELRLKATLIDPSL